MSRGDTIDGLRLFEVAERLHMSSNGSTDPLSEDQRTRYTAWLVERLRSWSTSTSVYDDVMRRLCEVALDEAAGKLARTEPKVNFCPLHSHSGGHYGCLVCACEELNSAVSEIDYQLGEPNVMRVSDYDLHCDPKAVVQRLHKMLRNREKRPAIP